MKVVDGVSLWSETFDRSTTDIFAVQDEVARAVIAALRGRVLAGNVGGAGTATRDPEAYDLYLQGRFYQAKRTTIDVERAIGLFEQALARDSLFVQAWTGLADAYLALAFYSNVPSIATLAQARTAVDRALAIDPDFGEALTTRAHLLFLQDWDVRKADSAFRRAIELSPGYGNAHKWYADLLDATGQTDRALESFTRALQLDPLSAITNTNLGTHFLAQGDTAQAMIRMTKALEIDPTLPLALRWIARIYFARGDTAAFFAAQERLQANSTRAGAPAAVLRRAWQSGGHDAVSRKQIEAFTAGKLWFERADWRAELGDFDGAFHDLDLAVQGRSILVPVVRSEILNPAFQRDPRFGALLRRVGLQDGRP
ncbi:MAG: tetratricopeptide repeat protein [Gemmatimonadota bacterium]